MAKRTNFNVACTDLNAYVANHCTLLSSVMLLRMCVVLIGAVGGPRPVRSGALAGASRQAGRRDECTSLAAHRVRDCRAGRVLAH